MVKKRPWSTKATWRDYKKEEEYNKSRTKYRAELNKVNRDKWTYWNGDKKDVSHTKSWYTLEPQSKNRARNGMRKWKSVSAPRVWTRK